MTTVDDIWTVAEPYLAAEHLELDDLELTGAGKGRLLRVVVDGDDLNVDRLAEVSRGLSRLLDHETALTDSYRLEVSSPGLERRLRRPGHYRKAVGREVRAKIRTSEQNMTLMGVIAAADESAFTVDLGEEKVVVPYEYVVKAKTVFRWEKSPKPGH